MSKLVTVPSIREHKPCYDPTRHLPEDWSGSIIDLLKQEQIPAVDRLWVARHYCSDIVNRLFACWCAEQSFRLQEKLGNKIDYRSKDAVSTARLYAMGMATKDTLSAAASTAWSAWSAAWSAARSAAWSAAWSAARSAESAARSAAASTAWSAESAAWSAAWSAARSAESAAWSAESAARSAESAAWSAESAARSAESEQVQALIQIIEQEVVGE